MHNLNIVCCGQSASHSYDSRLKMSSHKRDKNKMILRKTPRKKVNVSSSASLTKCNYLMHLSYYLIWENSVFPMIFLSFEICFGLGLSMRVPLLRSILDNCSTFLRFRFSLHAIRWTSYWMQYEWILLENAAQF